ncbi:PadR family transcriptional regulator [Limibacillus sp. MBR-115]|jgi:DNA-binding PadR family transcriptional regulator|uniref:PadR family transcriptional regulator n=1 Tax=Limibacillus sp. MBR-115 TaxID=3156465 RepID=UPI0033912A49
MDTKALCLAVLSRGEASGYEIKKSLESIPISALQEVSFGSIYPALNKLTEEESVVCRQETQTKRPDKKVYALTDLGMTRLIERLEQEPAPDRFRSDFLFTLSFAHFLEPSLVRRLIDDRIAFYETRIQEMEGCDLTSATPGGRFVHGFGHAVYQGALTYLRQQRAELLAALSDLAHKKTQSIRPASGMKPAASPYKESGQLGN